MWDIRDIVWTFKEQIQNRPNLHNEIRDFRIFWPTAVWVYAFYPIINNNPNYNDDFSRASSVQPFNITLGLMCYGISRTVQPKDSRFLTSDQHLYFAMAQGLHLPFDLRVSSACLPLGIYSSMYVKVVEWIREKFNLPDELGMYIFQFAYYHHISPAQWKKAVARPLPTHPR